jgi:hypothetical protein
MRLKKTHAQKHATTSTTKEPLPFPHPRLGRDISKELILPIRPAGQCRIRCIGRPPHLTETCCGLGARTKLSHEPPRM